MKKILIVGAGSRGVIYADCLQNHRDRVEIVGVAEPRADWRRRFAEKHGLAPANTFEDWRPLAERQRLADAVIIATPDHLHTEPAVAFADRGYHVLLEKPMATTAEDCCRVAGAAQRNGVMLAICYVLRYAPYTRKMKELLASGVIGKPISIEHLESVGYWHYGHSFVRGNWRNEKESSFMLLAKSCHDIDWLSYIMDAPCQRVSSFGSLMHFRADQAPAGAGQRCLACDIEPACPYSAKRLYLDFAQAGHYDWPVDILTCDHTEQGVLKALKDGPYGRCVYHCDNDVVDHQVVNIEFEGGGTGVFTMTAFTEPNQQRKTRIFGTRGQAYCDGDNIEVFEFLGDKHTTYPVSVEDVQGHGGGDSAIIESFVRALCENDPSLLLSGSQETLLTHLAVFAAEKARREGTVVDVKAFEKTLLR